MSEVPEDRQVIILEESAASGSACVFSDPQGEKVVQCCDNAQGPGVSCTVPENSNAQPNTVLLHDGTSMPVEPTDLEIAAEYPRQQTAGDTRTILYFRYAETTVGHGSSGSHVDKTPSSHEQWLAWLRGDQNATQADGPTLLHKAMAECLGTAMIVIIGCGSVCAATLTGAQAGLWQVAVVWGFGVALSIYATASISGAHLNPAVSLAFSLLRPASLPFLELFLYILAQLLGGVIGGLVNLAIFGTALSAFESKHGFTRGDAASLLTASCFGEYFPNPGFQYSAGHGPTLVINTALEWQEVITPFAACCIEAWGTGILVFMIFAFTDARNKVLVRKEMVPFFIGFTVACLISIYAPLTQAGWNPARDFGPRLVAYFAGWGEVAIPGPKNGFWVYIIGPCVGAPIGGALYEFVFARGLQSAKVE